MKKIGFFDAEYTRYTEEVIQAALVICDEEELARDEDSELISMTRYITPSDGAKIDSLITELTGITKEIIRQEGEPFSLVFSQMMELVEKNGIVNIYTWGEDRHVIRKNFLKNPGSFTRKKREAFLRKFTDISKPVSAAVVEKQILSQPNAGYIYGVDTSREHTAGGDADILKRLYSRYIRCQALGPEPAMSERAALYGTYLEDRKNYQKNKFNKCVDMSEWVEIYNSVPPLI